MYSVRFCCLLLLATFAAIEANDNGNDKTVRMEDSSPSDLPARSRRISTLILLSQGSSYKFLRVSDFIRNRPAVTNTSGDLSLVAVGKPNKSNQSSTQCGICTHRVRPFEFRHNVPGKKAVTLARLIQISIKCDVSSGPPIRRRAVQVLLNWDPAESFYNKALPSVKVSCVGDRDLKMPSRRSSCGGGGGGGVPLFVGNSVKLPYSTNGTEKGSESSTL